MNRMANVWKILQTYISVIHVPNNAIAINKNGNMIAPGSKENSKRRATKKESLSFTSSICFPRAIKSAKSLAAVLVSKITAQA